jgi:hypothetical protein
LRFLKEAAPGASATVEAVSTSGVAIFADGVQIVHVSQRDMYRKYGWPAKDALQKAVRAHVKKSKK